MALRGKIAIITGASSGIGAGIAEYFAKEGAVLSLNGRKKDNLDAVAKKCNELSSEPILTTVGDITKRDTRENIINNTKSKFGKINILVNNAGLLHLSPVSDLPEEKYDELLDANLKSPIFLTKLAIPHLTESKGCVVNISSMSSNMPGRNQAAYAISKVGLDTFTKIAAREMGPMGVRVNSVNPGFIVPTEILVRSNVERDVIDTFSASIRDNVPIGRNGTLEEIAHAVAFLASDKASFITGHSLLVDGGFLLVPGF